MIMTTSWKQPSPEVTPVVSTVTVWCDLVDCSCIVAAIEHDLTESGEGHESIMGMLTIAGKTCPENTTVQHHQNCLHAEGGFLN